MIGTISAFGSCSELNSRQNNSLKAIINSAIFEVMFYMSTLSFDKKHVEESSKGM